jgi:predicted DNA-binding transcriptional regulator AlpA
VASPVSDPARPTYDNTLGRPGSETALVGSKGRRSARASGGRSERGVERGTTEELRDVVSEQGVAGERDEGEGEAGSGARRDDERDRGEKSCSIAVLGGLWDVSHHTGDVMSSTQRAGESTKPTVRTLLTAEDVAQMIGMGVDWIYAQARLGRIRTVRLGRYRGFRLEAIEQWVRDLETDARLR